MNLLQNKVAVITGGTRGLGLAIARAYAAEGAAVVVASRSAQAVTTAVQDLQTAGYRASGLAVDVGDLEQMRALAAHAVQTFGRIDIWVNNAGVTGPYGPTLGMDPVMFQRVVQTNILGVYHGSLAAMRVFRAQGSGKLINMLGHGYNGPVTWQNAYAASKAWVRSFTATLAEENKDSGIGVYAFNPGMVLTDLLTDVEVIAGSEDRLRKFPAVVRMWAKPAEVPAQKAVWLASTATDGKTGLLVNFFSPWRMLAGSLGEALRKLRKQPAPALDIRLKTIPPTQE